MSIRKARELRKNMTPPERRLWNALKLRPEGFKFRKQHEHGAYYLDFFCYEAALAVEVDGLAHELGRNPQRDARRDAWLGSRGIHTVRVRATDVRDNLGDVVAYIVETCRQRSSQVNEGPSTSFAGPPPLQLQGRL